MTVTVYKSSDGSAPVLTGSVGTLLTVLDAILVNGYGSKAAAGWTKPFANSGNIGCYQNNATDGTGFCLNVNDAGPGAGGAREARMTGFETMSALSTGTGQFPQLSQLGIGIGAVVLRKSTTADATARVWTCIADDTVFYFFAETGDQSSPLAAYPFIFGDFFSYKISDPYRCCIIGRNIENSAAIGNEPFSALLVSATNNFLSSTLIGHFIARHWTGVGGSKQVGKHVDHGKAGMFGSSASSTGVGTIAPGNTGTFALGVCKFGFNLIPYPNGPDGGLYLSPIWLHHDNAVRGYLKGLWCPLHDRPINHNDTYSGSGNLSGKSFIAQAIPAAGMTGNNSTDVGQVHIETSTTWS